MVNNEEEQYFSRIAVAAVDLLAMKALLQKDDQAMSAMTALANLRTNSAENRYFHSSDLNSIAGTLYETEEYFGDSVYLFSDPSLDIGTQIDRLAVKCASLIMIGLHLYPRGFLLRAGIAVGDLRRKAANTARGKHEIRIGTAMAKAHLLQNSQDWIGGAVEPGFPGNPDDINRIKYEVPLKKHETPACSCKPEAINWVYILAINQYDEEAVLERVRSSMAQAGTLDSKEHNKLRNTSDFVRYVFGNEKYSGRS